MRVLIADDSTTMRRIIRRSLEASGIVDVVEAANGDQALEVFRAGAYDLVLTDWNMPGKTGVELVREIRSLDKKTPILMITTEAEKQRVIEAIQAGVTDYLIKPFTNEALDRKLVRFMEQV